MVKKFDNSNDVLHGVYRFDPSFLKWTAQDVVNVAKRHWVPCLFGLGLLFFMGVEYTLRMVPASSPPFDLGLLPRAASTGCFPPGRNSTLCSLLLIRPRATISALFLFTCRGILGYSTQLPVPEGFLGSGVDFPVGNVSFFLFFSGHVAGSVISSLDMRRMERWELAWTFDVLNVLQSVRLLGTRGHYTIDLAAGVGAGFLFDSLAGKYVECKRKKAITYKHNFERSKDLYKE
ncbi:hypothetical protein GH714_024066 [Hevea brasiliensis]|uniref:AtPDCT1/2 transmembrane domain-containing protein n=1 Tax=Hevea brasiliensis TaxID=3981 RepID=A0A6A6LMS7_HEVBR|nr:hypothetical protein GH714_024066 [Hevea brasiliensis]